MKKKKVNKSSKKALPAKEVETIKIGEDIFNLPYSDLFPRLSDTQFANLCDSIGREGIQIHIVVDEKFNVLDGEHRLRAAVKNGINPVPWEVRPKLTEEEKLQLMMDLNLNRRHLSPSQLEQLIITLRSKGKSLRQIAEKLGISHTTVNRKLADATVTKKTVELPGTIIGKDGKKRSAKAKPKKKPRITVNTQKEYNRVVEACDTIGSENLPNKSLTLKSLERKAREVEKSRLRAKEYTDFKVGNSELLFGDFTIKGNEIPDESAEMFFTDPPYSQKCLPLWSELAKFAERVLKPSGLLVTYTGSLYLPQVINMLGQHLNYVWPACITHSGSKDIVRAVQVVHAWKPILIYQKPPKKIYWDPFIDIVTGGRNKENHEWEQPVSEAAHYINALCPKNGILIDPMMGSGTSILAGLQCGVKKSIGIEIDGAAFATAQERINKVMDEQKRNAA